MSFMCFVFTSARKNIPKRRILEAYLLKVIAPLLTEQLDNDILIVFRSGVK